MLVRFGDSSQGKFTGLIFIHNNEADINVSGFLNSSGVELIGMASKSSSEYNLKHVPGLFRPTKSRRRFALDLEIGRN